MTWAYKEILFQPVGIVISGFKDKNSKEEHELYETTGEAIVEIFDEFKEGLHNLDKYYNCVWVIYWMHQITDNERNTMTRHPFNNLNLPEMGVFACGVGIRPNPIGITPCELIKVEDKRIYVRGLDALDGSPVLDIKPYCPQNYVMLGVECPHWIKSHHEDEVKGRIEKGD